MPGTWSVAAVLDRCPSLVEGLKEMTAGKANIMYAKGSNLISDAAYEERATMFGRSLNRDTDRPAIAGRSLECSPPLGHHHRSLGRIVRNERGKQQPH